jgi:hypothetical protein
MHFEPSSLVENGVIKRTLIPRLFVYVAPYDDHTASNVRQGLEFPIDIRQALHEGGVRARYRDRHLLLH